MPALTSSIAIGYTNLASGRTITATTAATGYPAANLAIPALGSSWHSTTASLTSQRLAADLGSAKDFDVIAAIGFNGEDDAVGKFLASESSDLSSPEYDSGSSTTWDTTTYPVLLDDAPPYGRNFVHFPGTTQNARYGGVTLSDLGNPANYLSVRVLWIGPIWQPADSFLIEQEKWAVRQQVVGVPGVQRALRAMDLELYMLTESEARKLESVVRAKMSTGRLLVVPRPTLPETFLAETLYCRLDLEKSPPARYIIPTSGGLRWKISMSFLECED